MHRAASIAIVGAGPRGIGVLERIAANLDELWSDQPLVVHLVDPHPPGGGKVWRFDQSPLLRLNSMACDITMFTDDTVTCEGPIRPGPSMADWAPLATDLPTDALREEAAAVTPITFPTRRLGGEYLGWVYRRAVAALPPSVEIRVHAATAIDVIDRIATDRIATDDPVDGPVDGPVDDSVQVVHLDDGTSLEVDAVVLTLGHLDTETTGESATMAEHARRFGLAYLPPAYGTESDLSVFAAGDDVIMRGFGLGFVDLLVLLTEGRGGRYHEVGDGTLRYEPSGEEPHFHIGSRRGVPYRSKLTYRLQGPRPTFPRFFDRDAIDAVMAAHDVVDFRMHIWPLIAKEIAWAAYHELANGHVGRVTLPWDELDRRLAAVDWGTAEWDRIVAESVPAVEDRIDFEALDRPLDALWFDDSASLQEHMREHITADLRRRADVHFSADLGAFDAFLAVFAQLPFVLGSPKLSPRSRVRDFDDWWFGFFSYYASGPPPRRMQELLALSRAGIVQFLGRDTWVRADESSGSFVGGSASSPHTVTARGLVEARLPGPSVASTRSALVRAMTARGELSELILTEADGTPISTGQVRVSMRDQRVVAADDRTHLRRFALGQHSTSRAPAFVRPNTNAMALRHNDICARAVLSVLSRQPEGAHA